METKTTLQKLIELLSKNDKHHYNSIFKSLNFDATVFLDFESWSREKYTRNCIYRDDNFELILLCWEAGQETTIHCHGGEECWVYLLEGEVEEVFYSKDENENVLKNGKQKLLKHKASYINDSIGVHQLKNSYDGRTMSLHLYAKPIEVCTFYDEESQSFIKKELSYDTFRDFALKNI